MKFLLTLLLPISLIVSCSNNDETENTNLETPPSNFVIPKGKSFEWRLDNIPEDFTTEADVIDIDAFESSAQLVANLKAQGKNVIAYISVGSAENYREDYTQFPQSVLGNDYDGYPDEKWLDIRQIELLSPIIKARLDMIVDKGFDGIEPDNMNGYQNETGFDLNEENTKNYCRWLIEQAHSRGLSIGQKNGEELVTDMADEFDWMLSEDAYVYNFQDMLQPYIQLNKAMFLVEYTDEFSESQFRNNICPDATEKGFSPLLKNRDLSDVTVRCE